MPLSGKLAAPYQAAQAKLPTGNRLGLTAAHAKSIPDVAELLFPAVGDRQVGEFILEACARHEADFYYRCPRKSKMLPTWSSRVARVYSRSHPHLIGRY